MSFDSKGFSPAHINAGPLAPRIFTYFNKEDLLSEIMEPGYFNKQKMVLRPNTFIKVVCADAIVELIVEKNTGEVTMKDEFLRATNPYMEMKAPGRKRRKKKSQNKDALAETG